MKRAQHILLLLGILGLVVVFLLNLTQFSKFIKLITHIRIYIVLLVVLVQLVSYYLNGLYYRSIIKRVFGYSIPVLRLFEGALAANFVNYVAPTAGMAGAAYLSQVLKPEVPRGEGVLTQIMRYALSALAVLLMLPVGITLVIISRSESASVNHAAIISASIIVFIAVLILALVQQETFLRRVVNRLGLWLSSRFKKVRIAQIEKFADDFYLGYHKITARKRALVVPFAWSIAYILVEVLTVYMAFLAFGKVLNPGIAVMGYLLANIASTLGGTFFATGVYELGMLGTFVALGIPLALALSVTIFYRVLNLVIGLPPGFYYYRKYLKVR